MFVETSETSPAPDTALAPLAEAILAVPPAPAAKAIAQPATEQIIGEMTATCRKAEQFALCRIDAAIERLQALREQVQQKCRANIDWTIDFVRLVEGGMREVDKLETSSDKIAEAAS